MKPLHLLIAAICFVSCTQQKHEEEASSLLKLKSKFKYHNLKDFTQVDTFNFDTRPGHYEEVDSNMFKLIFKGEKRSYVGTGYDHDFYYSWQERDSNFIEFTILTQSEEDYCAILRYYIFDKKDKLISKFDLSADCGDAGWTFFGNGRQVDKHHFVFETIESESNMDEKDSRTGDSINYSYTIDAKGKVTRKEIFNKHFGE